MDPQFLVVRMFPMGRWLLWLRTHRLCRTVRLYLVVPKFLTGLLPLLLRRHLRCLMVPQSLEAHLCHSVRWLLLHRTLRLCRTVRLYLEGHSFRMAPLLRLLPRLPQFPKALRFLEDRYYHSGLLDRWLHSRQPFHLVQQFLEDRMFPMDRLLLLRHLLRGRRWHLLFPKALRFLVVHLCHSVRWLLWLRTHRLCRKVRLFLEGHLFLMDPWLP
jgi:hypothetical protein